MVKNFCDRCGRITKNSPTCLLSCSPEHGIFQCNGVWYGEPITLCNYCLKDFEDFRVNHETFNKELMAQKS